MGYFPNIDTRHPNAYMHSSVKRFPLRSLLNCCIALSVYACGPDGEDFTELVDDEFGQSVQAQSRWGGGSGGGGNGSVQPQISGATGHMFTASTFNGQHIWIDYCSNHLVDADGTGPQLLQLYDINGGNLENGDVVNLLAGNGYRGFNVNSYGNLIETDIHGNYGVLLTPQYQFRAYRMSGSGAITTSNTPGTQVVVSIALQAVVNNLYVQAPHGGGHGLNAIAPAPYGWETFVFTLTAGLQNVHNHHGCFG